MVFYTSIFRRDLIIVFAVICLFTIIFSLRSVAPEPQPLPLGNEYKPPQHGTPGTNKPDLDETRPPSQKDPKPSAKAPIAQSKPDPTSTISKPTPSAAPPQTCDGFPNTEDVLVVMKTGATEAYDKLPIHFITTLECVNDYIIFSDMPMDMAGHKLHDALDEIPEEVKKDNADFDLYKKLQEYHRLGEDPRLLRTGSVGWNLDKYKFLPMLAKTWKYRQDAKWYLFIEADTAVIWDNLRLFLDKFDAKKPHYFGSPTYLDIEFAHGGTGYIISQAAMKSAVGGHLDIETKFGMDVAPICCGDRMIAAVLKEEDIKLTKAWPMLNGEKPLTVPYNNKHWCTPVLTMHHLTAQEVSQVWNFEKERKAKGIKTPLIWRDVFYKFTNQSLTAQRDDWQNLSDDLQLKIDSKEDALYDGKKWADLSEVMRSSIETSDKCKAACEAEPRCMQWVHSDLKCHLHWSIRQGASKSPEESNRWTSGWHLGRIEKFKAAAGDCPASAIKWDVQPPQ